MLIKSYGKYMEELKSQIDAIEAKWEDKLDALNTQNKTLRLELKEIKEVLATFEKVIHKLLKAH